MVALSYEQFESLIETLEILSDQEFMVDLRQGIEQAKSGKTVSLKSLKATLGF
jgi:PHD/YefM family antitoxin component YafN of YafNO toxin-antitoxin module